MVSFELTKKTKYVFSSYHERGTKKQFWVLTRNRTSDFRFPRSDALPLSHSESVVSKPFIDQLIKLSHWYLELFVVLFACFCFVFLPDYFILWSVARKQFETRLVNLVDVNIDKLIDGCWLAGQGTCRPCPWFSYGWRWEFPASRETDWWPVWSCQGAAIFMHNFDHRNPQFSAPSLSQMRN